MNRDDWNRRYSETERVWSVEANRFLVEEVGSLQPGSALDIACGEGRNALWLAEIGWQVDAVDFSTAGLATAGRAAEECGVQVHWIENDVETGFGGGDSYDLVLLFYLQLPWKRMRGVIKRAVDVVAPGGTFLLVGHDRTNLEHGHGGPRSPDVLYTPEQVAGELGPLAVIEAARRPRPVETDDGPFVAIDCLVRASRLCGG